MLRRSANKLIKISHQEKRFFSLSNVKFTTSASPSDFLTKWKITTMESIEKSSIKELNLSRISNSIRRPFNRSNMSIERFRKMALDENKADSNIDSRNFIVVVGGRQCGKSTLIAHVLSEAPLGLSLNLRRSISIVNVREFHKHLESQFINYLLSPSVEVLNKVKKFDYLNVNPEQTYNITKFKQLLEQMESYFMTMKKKTDSTPVLFIDEADLLFNIPDCDGYRSCIDSTPNNQHFNNSSWLQAFLGWCVEQTVKKGSVKIVMASSNSFFTQMISNLEGYFETISINELTMDETMRFISENAPKIQEPLKSEIANTVGGRIGDLSPIIGQFNANPSLAKDLVFEGLKDRAISSIYFGCNPYPTMVENPKWTGAIYWHVMEKLVENNGSFPISQFPSIGPDLGIDFELVQNMIRYKLINVFSGKVYAYFPYLLNEWKEIRNTLKFRYYIRRKSDEDEIQEICLSMPLIEEFQNKIQSYYTTTSLEMKYGKIKLVSQEDFLTVPNNNQNAVITILRYTYDDVFSKELNKMVLKKSEINLW